MNNPTKPSIKSSIEKLLGADKLKPIIVDDTLGYNPAFPVQNLIPNPNQPRHNFSADELNELIYSIKQDGVLLPLLIRINHNNEYEIIAGERRWRAAKIVGLKTVPVIIKDVSADDSLILAVIENIKRAQLNVIEEAQAFAQLINKFQLTHDELANRIGRPRSSITNILRLLTLPQALQDALQTGQLHFGHAKLLFSCDNEMAATICAQIIAKKLSVRQTELLLNKILKQPLVSKNLTSNDSNIDFSSFIEPLKKIFSTDIKISSLANGKQKLELIYESPQALQENITRFIEQVV